MISFADFRPEPRPPEVRQASGYSNAIISAIEAAAAGGASVATATAAVETASAWWGRALSLARVEPRNRRTMALTPSVLELIGRELGRRGEIVFDLDVTGGRVRMLPASSSYVVLGGADPREWLYNLTLFGPGNSTTVYRPRAGVVHVAYGRSVERPWEGRAPWQSASLSADLLTGVERQLSGEARGASGYVLPVPDTGDKGQGEDDDGEDDPIVSLRRDLAAAAGKTMIAPTQQAGYGAGPGAAPQSDYKSERFGLKPPESTIELRRDVERSILAAFGLLPVLFNHQAPGASLREAWRTAHTLSVEPVAELVGAQLSEALGVDVKLDMRRARAADVATLARAVASLVQAGMTPETAREVVGI